MKNRIYRDTVKLIAEGCTKGDREWHIFRAVPDDDVLIITFTCIQCGEAFDHGVG